MSSYRILVTDPCFVKSPEDYTNTINEGTIGLPSTYEPGHYVPVRVTQSFFDELKVQFRLIMKPYYIARHHENISNSVWTMMSRSGHWESQ